MMMDEHTYAMFKNVPMEELDPQKALELALEDNASLRKRNELLRARVSRVVTGDDYKAGRASMESLVVKARKDAGNWEEAYRDATAKLEAIEEVLFGDRCPTCG